MLTTMQDCEALRLALTRLQAASASGAGSAAEAAARREVFAVLTPEFVLDLLTDAESAASLQTAVDDLSPCVHCQEVYNHPNHHIGGGCVSFKAPMRQPR